MNAFVSTFAHQRRTMTENIEISKKARIVGCGNPNSAKIGMLALHGYGQLVPYFIRIFKHLDENNFYVIAPEGLHRFYLNGTSGRVGASWMTKEERQIDIADNLNYLDRVYDVFFKPFQFKQFVVLGFSQGAATAARWIDHTEVRVHAFIQWAGVFPPDLDLSLGKKAFSNLRHFYVVGDEDPYFSEPERVNSQKVWLEENGLLPEFVQFQGGHKIDSDGLSKILELLL